MSISAIPPKRSTSSYEVKVGPVTLLFSYATLVGVSTENECLRAPRGRYSRTTGRHINETGFGDCKEATHDELIDAALRAIRLDALETIKYRIGA